MNEQQQTQSVVETRRAIRILAAATLLLFFVISGVVAWGLIDSSSKRVDLKRQAAALRVVAVSTNHALCALRTNLTEQILASTQFLISHPNGIPGISAEQIQQGIARTQLTIDALSDLTCPPEHS